jgi:tripartite-type tricarboxylate transporter receptor subunit TctC
MAERQTNKPEDIMRNWIIAATLSLLSGLPALAGDYPDRPLKLIVPFAAGGVTDVVARVSAEFLGAKLNQAVIVENVPGAGGNTGIAQMIKAGKDGYTLGLVATGNLAINPHLFAKMPFDALKDVAPIAVIAEAPQLLVISSTVPAKNLTEFIAYAKAHPGKISYGSAGVGTTNHLAADAFARATGVEMVHVPFRGAAPAVNDLIGGHIDFMAVAAAPVIQHIQAGALRSLGVAAPNRLKTLPDQMTVAEAGLDNYNATTWFGIVAPTGTDPAIIQRLNGYLREMTTDAEVLKKFDASYLEPMSFSIAQFQTLVREDFAKWKGIVEASGARLE